MGTFTNESAENYAGKEPSTQAKTIQSTAPTSDLPDIAPPIVVKPLPRINKQAKRRPVSGLHLGSLPQAPMSDNSKSLFVNQAFNPFFSNIRQNMELSPSGIKERIPVRFPEGMQYKPENGSVMKNGKDQPLRHCVGMLDNYTLPPWLQRCLAPDTGETLIAKSYEVCPWA